MALRFFGRSSTPAASSADPKLAGGAPTTAQKDTYLPGDALPLPEVEEKNTDSVWAAWTDAVNEKEEPEQPEELLPNFLQTTGFQRPVAGSEPAELDDGAGGDQGFPATVIMDLPEMLRGRE